MEISLDWRNLFFSYRGRIGRKAYSIGFGILLLITALTSTSLLGWIWLIAAVYFFFCVYAKRLHDIGVSAVTLLIPFGAMAISVPIAFFTGVGSFLVMASQRREPLLSQDLEAGIYIGLAILVFVWILFPIGATIWLGVAGGNTNDNEFGSAVSQ